MKTENKSGMKITYDLTGLNGLEKNHSGFFNEMIRLFIKGTSAGMLEMQDALDAGNWTLVAEKAHKMLGPCKHMDVMPLAGTLKSIENNIFEAKKTDQVAELVSQAKAEADETISLFKKLIAE